jgi:hypothetical protein
LIAVVAFAGMGKKCPKKNSGGGADDKTVIKVYTDVVQTTPENKVRIASRSGVPANFVATVDRSMNDLRLDIAAENLVPQNIAPEQAIIYALEDCTLSPEQRAPSFLMNAPNYDGTEYDQDPRPGYGKVYAAEYVVSTPTWNNPLGFVLHSAWVVCSRAAGAPVSDEYTFNVARYGYEHKFLFDTQPERFRATMTHTNGAGHPLIAPRQQRATERNPARPDAVPVTGAVAGGLR